LAEAMAQEMRRDASVVVWGLDIGAYGGAFEATKGLFAEFGPERVVDMPISEAGYVGAAVGAAATGLRPVVELQFSDWITIASDMLINQAAKMRYMFGGLISVPLVLRAPSGGYIGAGAQHSQSFESWFSFVPGLKVVFPATPYDAKGLLKSAIRDNNPVIFFEHKALYSASKGYVPQEFEDKAMADKLLGHVPEEDYTIPLGVAEVKRSGHDVTIVTYGYTVGMSLGAAEKLAGEGISVEVIDLRTLSPIDEQTILESVRKTGRLVVVQETWRRCSISSEVTAIVAEHAWNDLKTPVIRVTCKDVPVPAAPILEEYVLPQETDIVAAVKRCAEN